MRQESLKTDLTRWEIGPYHGALPGPMRLKLLLDGEIVVSGQVETGYLHRGLEKALEIHTWQASIAYADHLDPEGAVFGELALCLSVEEVAEIEVPPRAQTIRMILSELARISSHLGFIVRMARAVGAETMVHYVLRDRERILDLFELLTGARFSLNFLRFGGVKADITEGFIERVLEVADLMQVRLKEYNDLFTFNHAFLKRTVDIGIISPALVAKYGITGPAARGSGVAFDVRKVAPYSGYQELEFLAPVETGAGERMRAFWCICARSQKAPRSSNRRPTECPAGEFQIAHIEKEFAVPAGEGYARIESSRGMLACHVVANDTAHPARVQFRTPSAAHLAVIPELLPGIRIEDLPVLLLSLDLGLAEADR